MTTHHTKGVLINDLDQTSRMTSITSSSLKNSTSLQPQDYIQLNNTKKQQLQQSSTTTNDLIELEKTKFFNILKSLFAIFDPECNGYIDLNELDVLGANNNEILNDVLNYIRSNRTSNLFNPNKILTTINQNLIQTNINNNKHKFLVNFDEFVTASELVLDKRRQSKYQSLRQINENTNLTQSLSCYSNLNRQSIPIQKIINSSNSTSSSSSSTSSSATSSTVSIPNPSSLSPNTHQTQTLSQAFETKTSTSSIQSKTQTNNSNQILNNANSCDLNVLIDKECYILKQGLESIECIKQWFTNQLIENKVKQTNVNKLKYQNLFSIDKMLIDLRRLNDLNNYLNEFMKKNSMSSSSSCSRSTYDDINRSSCLLNGLNEPPSYRDYIEQFSCINSKTDAELDQYLKEKQDRIDNLQKEKSSLIRKLFEIKSESENISKNILKLNKNNKFDSNSFNLNEKEIPILIDKANTTSTTSTATTTTHKFL